MFQKSKSSEETARKVCGKAYSVLDLIITRLIEQKQAALQSGNMGSEYDVFISFRGPDTRYGITDHLYECMSGAGLRVFKDDEEIRRSEVIGGELERAIVNSSLYAVILSNNYASSAWCLRELAMMVDLQSCSSASRKIILPIFYGVDPCDVKLQTQLFQKALDKHKGRYGHEVVKKWEEALVSVSRISGWDSQAIPW